MAKVAFNKLNKVKSIPDIVYEWEGNEFVIKQYLPLEKKINLIQSIINLSFNEEEGFYNIIKVETFYVIEMLKNYTNISFTEKQEEDPVKLYDGIKMNHIWEIFAEQIPEEERVYIWDKTLELITEITKYNNSILGILTQIKTNYDVGTLQIGEFQENLFSPEVSNFLQQLAPMLNSQDSKE